jgi:hypothetical protein
MSISGPTAPNGGIYSIAYWQDADGNPTTPDKAVTAEVHEMDEQNQSIFRTYGSLERFPQ